MHEFDKCTSAHIGALANLHFLHMHLRITAITPHPKGFLSEETGRSTEWIWGAGWCHDGRHLSRSFPSILFQFATFTLFQSSVRGFFKAECLTRAAPSPSPHHPAHSWHSPVLHLTSPNCELLSRTSTAVLLSAASSKCPLSNFVSLLPFVHHDNTTLQLCSSLSGFSAIFLCYTFLLIHFLSLQPGRG